MSKTEWLQVESKAADVEWRREYDLDGYPFTGIVAVYRKTEGRRLVADRYVALLQYTEGRTLRLDACESRAQAERAVDRHVALLRVKKL